MAVWMLRIWTRPFSSGKPGRRERKTGLVSVKHSSLWTVLVCFPVKQNPEMEPYLCCLPISIFTSSLPGLNKASSIRSGLLVIPGAAVQMDRWDRQEKEKKKDKCQESRWVIISKSPRAVATVCRCVFACVCVHTYD